MNKEEVINFSDTSAEELVPQDISNLDITPIRETSPHRTLEIAKKAAAWNKEHLLPKIPQKTPPSTTSTPNTSKDETTSNK